jgi:hypothetical protein
MSKTLLESGLQVKKPDDCGGGLQDLELKRWM